MGTGDNRIFEVEEKTGDVKVRVRKIFALVTREW